MTGQTATEAQEAKTRTVPLGIDRSMSELVGDENTTPDELYDRAIKDVLEARREEPIVEAMLKTFGPLGPEICMALLARELLRANRELRKLIIDKQARTTPELIIAGNRVERAVANLLRGR